MKREAVSNSMFAALAFPSGRIPSEVLAHVGCTQTSLRLARIEASDQGLIQRGRLTAKGEAVLGAVEPDRDVEF